MAVHDKSKEELIIELEQLKQENSEIKLENDVFRKRLMNCEAIFESSPIAMFIIDETTNIVMVNLAAVKLCGGSEEEILQHRPGNALRCVHSAKDPRGCGFSPDCKTCEVRNAIEALIAKGGAVNGAELEFSLYHDGVPQKVWMNVGVEPVIKDGEKHWCIAMSDITNSKLVKESLRISEERFHGIFNNLQDAFFQADLSGNFTLISPAALKMFGYNLLEEMIGMPASCLYSDADVRVQLITDLHSKGHINDFECEGKRKDGSTFWASMNVRFMYQNGIVSGTEGIVRDISDRKLAERALKEKEEEYRTLVENLAVGIVVHDASSAITLSNNTATQLLGLTNDQIEGRSAIDPKWGFLNEDFSVMPVDDYPANIVLASGMPLKNYVLGICRPNLGDVIWVICNGYPVFDQYRKIKNVVITFADITSRKNAEFEVVSAKEKIEESEYRLKLATSSAGLGIWDWNLKENTMIWDARMFELYGTTPDTFPNNIDAWTNGLHPEDKQKALDECNAALNGEKEFNTSFRVMHPNGTVLYIKANGSVLRDENGKPYRMIGINRDITERRLATAQLHIAKEKAEESEQKYKSLFTNMTNAFGLHEMIFNEKGEPIDYIFLEVNSVWEKVVGIKAEFVIGKRIREIMPSIEQSWIDRYGRIVLTGIPEEFIDYNEATQKHYNVFAYKLKGNKFAVMFNDVSDKKKFEFELIKAKEKAEENEKNLNNTFNVSPSIIGKVNVETGCFVEVNQAVTRILGYTADEFKSKPLIEFIHPDDRQRTFDLISEIKKGYTATYFENRYLSKDGYYKWIAWNTSKLDKNSIGMAIGTDISGQKMYEFELISAKEKAEESDRLKSAFLANMSHEIRTPLNSIIGFSDLLVDPDFEPEQKTEFLNLIHNSGDNLLAIISDIIDISKIETGQLTINKIQFSVEKLLNEIFEENNLKAIEKGVDLRINFADRENTMTLHSDPSRLKQILTNFVSNSIKFTERGYVEIGFTETNNSVQISVKDTGIGIPREYHENIFERFRQVESSHTRKYGGNGLGLAISKQLADLLGYKLWMESEVGTGSIFYLSAPKNIG